MNMNDMRPNNKIELFQNYKGLVSELTFCTVKEVKAPFEKKDLSDCLIDVNFAESGISGQYIKNKGSLPDIAFSGSYQTKWANYDICNLYSDCNGGTFEAESKFDGIACDDGHIFPKLSNPTSYFRFKTPAQGNWLSEATVEFWFKLDNPSQYSENVQLFALYDEMSDQDYFEIFIQGGELVCAPFGVRSVRNPLVAFTAFNQENEDEFGWWHISCSYSFQQKTTGTIFNTKVL